VPTLRASANAAVAGTQLVEVSIDGLSLSQLGSYRAKSPDAFSVTLPAGNVPEFLGLPTPAGTYTPQVADGYWLMLTPLPPGNHTISVHVVNPSQGLDYIVKYNLHVG
jgi:hypothetical protein